MMTYSPKQLTVLIIIIIIIIIIINNNNNIKASNSVLESVRILPCLMYLTISLSLCARYGYLLFLLCYSHVILPTHTQHTHNTHTHTHTTHTTHAHNTRTTHTTTTHNNTVLTSPRVSRRSQFSRQSNHLLCFQQQGVCCELFV